MLCLRLSNLGKPDISPRLKLLKPQCLQDHEDVLYADLDPFDVCDFLFEEKAIQIPVHDKITEKTNLKKQIKYLLETLNENENDCFYFFLHILENMEYNDILKELADNVPGTVKDGMFKHIVFFYFILCFFFFFTCFQYFVSIHPRLLRSISVLFICLSILIFDCLLSYRLNGDIKLKLTLTNALMSSKYTK